MDLSGSELLIVLLVVVVLFGAARLPQLGRNLGRSISEFKRGLAGAREDGASDEGAAAAADPEAAPRDGDRGP